METLRYVPGKEWISAHVAKYCQLHTLVLLNMVRYRLHTHLYLQVIDSSTLSELAHFPGQHSKSRLFRHGEGGVADLDIMPGGKLYSCGADGSIKCQTLKL